MRSYVGPKSVGRGPSRNLLLAYTVSLAANSRAICWANSSLPPSAPRRSTKKPGALAWARMKATTRSTAS